MKICVLQETIQILPLWKPALFIHFGVASLHVLFNCETEPLLYFVLREVFERVNRRSNNVETKSL